MSYIFGENLMQLAKLFQNGCSEAVGLAKVARKAKKEVKTPKQGNKIILEPIETSWDTWFNTLNTFSDDFMQNGREQPAAQERES